LEATYREKNSQKCQGYTANLTETCDPENPFQLITKTQTAPNCTDDSQLLADALANLKERSEVNTIYSDGGFGGSRSDPVLEEQKVELIQTAIRGRQPNSETLHLADFEIKLDEQSGKPTQITCPHGQKVAVHPTSQKKGCVASFDPEVCSTCPFFEKGQCPTRPGKQDGRPRLRFTQSEAQVSQRRRRSQKQKKTAGNLRAAVEATVRSVKHPFRGGKLPVRGLFRVTCMVIGSAAVTNIRRIQRYLADKKEGESDQTTSLESQRGASAQKLHAFLSKFGLGVSGR
jgi:hypothetical protein